MTDLITQYLNEATALGLRPNSAAVRRRVLASLALALVPTGLLDATSQQLLTWLTSTPDWSLSTRQSYRSHIVSFFTWAHDRGHIPTNPAAMLPKVKLPRRLPRPVEPAEVLRALSTARAPDMRAMLALGAFAGLRCFEIAAVRGEHLVTEPHPLLHIPEEKGGGQAVVPAHQVLVDIAAEMPATGWWFPRRDGLDHVHATIITNRGSSFLHAIGINATMHQLRHSFGTQLYEQSEDLRVVQELMRHRSPASTALYTQVSDSKRAAVLQRLDYAPPVAS